MKTIPWAPLLLLACAACGPRATVQTPPGFAVLDDQKEYVYRAASADGVVVAVRAEKNEPKGNLDFWAEALDQKLRHGGYVPEGPPAAVRTAAGLPGREARYTHVQGGHKYRFWFAVFVTESRVWVVEAGGDEEGFKGRVQEGIQRAIESLGTG
jgi:hypothetical protein